MKYIFLIHSQITYAVSLGVIEKENISPNDVVFLGDRGFVIESEYRFFPIDFPNYYYLLRKNFILGIYYLARVDFFIKKITEGGLFIIYCPHTYLNIVKIMLTHKFCQGHFLIEEGLSSYCEFLSQKISPPPVFLNRKQRALSRFIYKSRWIDTIMFRSDHMGTYAIHPDAFPGFSNLSIVRPKFSIKYENQKIHFYKKKFIVIVFDSLVENRILSIESYLMALRVVAKDIVRKFPGVDVVYCKLHPYQVICDRYYPTMINELSSYLGQSIRLINLPNDFSIEGQSAMVETIAYSVVSSVSIYVNWAGGTAYSAAKNVDASETKFHEHLDNLPVVFNKAIIFI